MFICVLGTWVQCCSRSCKKWRYLCDVSDPSVLPENWFCNMNNGVCHLINEFVCMQTYIQCNICQYNFHYILLYPIFIFSDTDYNECDKAEQEYNEEEHIYTSYTEGTVVWARMSGFPWWVHNQWCNFFKIG